MLLICDTLLVVTWVIHGSCCAWPEEYCFAMVLRLACAEVIIDFEKSRFVGIATVVGTVVMVDVEDK